MRAEMNVVSALLSILDMDVSHVRQLGDEQARELRGSPASWPLPTTLAFSLTLAIRLASSYWKAMFGAIVLAVCSATIITWQFGAFVLLAAVIVIAALLGGVWINCTGDALLRRSFAASVPAASLAVGAALHSTHWRSQW